MEERPIDRLLREKGEDAIEKDEDTLIFLSPDQKSASKLIIDRYERKLIIETTLHHSTRMIDENIYMSANSLSNQFSDTQIRDIIDDISARLRLMELPELLQKIQYGFETVEKEEEYTKFAYELFYGDEEISYETLREKFETILMNSFELIYEFLLKIGLFIHTALEEFKLQPEMTLKLLRIRSLLFDAKFHEKMTGRFAGDQLRIARSMKKDALDLINQFKEEYPKVATEKLRKIQNFFEIQI
ncbi:MAG: hypothetical protein ACTSQI_12780 [Candidatus Helarchaeota archaeon]